MPLIDRTKLLSLLGNLVPSYISDSKKMKESLLVVHDTMDSSYNEHTTHKSALEIDHPNGSVTTQKIANEAITPEKLAPGAVTPSKITKESVTQFAYDKTETDSKIAGAVTEQIPQSVIDQITQSATDKVNNLAGADRTTETVRGNAVALETHKLDALKHITALERTTWNGKETTIESQKKATQALTDAKNYTDGKTGTLSSLSTNSKGTLVAAINELFLGAVDIKTKVVRAINGKGGSASIYDTGDQLEAKIGQISTGIKVATGTFGTSTQTGTVPNLPFKPMIAIFHGQISTATNNSTSAVATGGLLIYNLGGGNVAPYNLYTRMQGNANANVTGYYRSFVFGDNYVNFDGFSVGFTEYTIFGV